jgi:hypothetical protein
VICHCWDRSSWSTFRSLLCVSCRSSLIAMIGVMNPRQRLSRIWICDRCLEHGSLFADILRRWYPFLKISDDMISWCENDCVLGSTRRDMAATTTIIATAIMLSAFPERLAVNLSGSVLRQRLKRFVRDLSPIRAFRWRITNFQFPSQSIHLQSIQ